MLWLFSALALAAGGGGATQDGLRYWEERADRGGTIVVVTYIDASPERVLDVIVDVEARWTDVSALRSAAVTEQDAAHLDVAYVFQCATGMQHAFDLTFDVDRDAGFVRFAVDPERPGFFEVMSGSYLVTATPGGSQLTYTSAVQTSGWVPAFLKGPLVTERALQEVAGIRHRAEAPS